MTEINPLLAQYVHPDYWDGHSIGVGEVEPFPSHQLTRNDNNELSRTLLDYLATNTQRFPLETYMDGDTFSSAAYEPGTIVCMKSETLLGGPNHVPSLINLADVTPGEPNRNIPPGLPIGFTEHDTLISDLQGMVYSCLTQWGVVYTSRRQTTPILGAIPASLITSNSGGKLKVNSVFSPNSDLTVGETTHYGGSRHGHEIIKRALRLEVCAYGKPQGSHSPRFSQGFLGWLAPNAT